MKTCFGLRAMTLIGPVVLVLTGCRDASTPAGVAGGENWQNSQAEFDPYDLAKTLAWCRATAAGLNGVERQENEFASKEARERVASTLASLVGRTVAWRIPVKRIDTACVHLQDVWYDDRTDHPICEISYGPGTREMPSSVLRIGEHISKERARGLSAGSTVAVKGAIESVKIEDGWALGGRFKIDYITINLVDVQAD